MYTLIPAALEAAFLISALNLQSEYPDHCLQDMVWSFLEASKNGKQLINLRVRAGHHLSVVAKDQSLTETSGFDKI